MKEKILKIIEDSFSEHVYPKLENGHDDNTHQDFIKEVTKGLEVLYPTLLEPTEHPFYLEIKDEECKHAFVEGWERNSINCPHPPVVQTEKEHTTIHSINPLFEYWHKGVYARAMKMIKPPQA